MRQARYVLVDDIDGSVAAETVSFAFGKQQYEIDLSEAHAKEFREQMERWISHARKVTARRGRATGGVVAGDAAAIRSWAESQGIQMSSRGRIPASVREQYYRESMKSN